MGTAHYLVAKYVPDVFRNEPVNIGVLTWIDGRVAWQFLGQKPDGNIDGRAQGVSGKIKSVANYKQWVENWVTRLNAPRIRTKQGFVSRESPDFLNALATYAGGSYVLEAGGEIMDDTDPQEVASVASYLFNTLVGAPDEREQYKSAEEMRDELLREAAVFSDPRVKLNWPVPLQLRGKAFNPKFSVYIGNGTPEVLGQMVPLTASGRTAQNSARAAELMFLRVLDAGILPQEKCIAFVYTREDEETAEVVAESLEELSAVCTIMDISTDRAPAVRRLSTWVEEAKAH